MWPRSTGSTVEIDNLTMTELNLLSQKFIDLDSSVQEMRALIDQKFNHIEGYVENLESRISNLR
jgi:hypothetical protein